MSRPRPSRPAPVPAAPPSRGTRSTAPPGDCGTTSRQRRARAEHGLGARVSGARPRANGARRRRSRTNARREGRNKRDSTATTGGTGILPRTRLRQRSASNHRRDVECRGGRTALLPLPHGRQRRLEAAAEAIVSNSAACERASASFRRTAASFARRTGETQRQCLVVADAGGDELGQAGGDEQARATRLGNARPVQVSTGSPVHSASLGRGVRVVRQRVDEQVGQAVPREMSPPAGRARANATRAAAIPRASASRRRLRVAATLSSSSHNALPGTARAAASTIRTSRDRSSGCC